MVEKEQSKQETRYDIDTGDLYYFGLLQDSLVEESSQGNFFPGGCCDILVEAIGRPEHCGHVRAVGKEVEIKLF